jgi:hypothetical protein
MVGPIYAPVAGWPALLGSTKRGGEMSSAQVVDRQAPDSTSRFARKSPRPASCDFRARAGDPARPLGSA